MMPEPDDFPWVDAFSTLDPFDRLNELLGHSCAYDRDGQPIDYKTWAVKHADRDYHVVRQTTIRRYWISTVWLGLDHSWGHGPPLIFETMIFVKRGSGDYQRRASTESQAWRMHSEVCRMVHSGWRHDSRRERRWT